MPFACSSLGNNIVKYLPQTYLYLYSIYACGFIFSEHFHYAICTQYLEYFQSNFYTEDGKNS